MHHAVFSTNGRGTISCRMKNHAVMRRAVDLNNRVLKQNYDRDTTCVLRTVCEYKPLSHPHHCCQITSNLGSALAKGLATASRETTGFTEAPPSRRLSKTAAAARTALPTTRSTDLHGGRTRVRAGSGHPDGCGAPAQHHDAAHCCLDFFKVVQAHKKSARDRCYTQDRHEAWGVTRGDALWHLRHNGQGQP